GEKPTIKDRRVMTGSFLSKKPFLNCFRPLAPTAASLLVLAATSAQAHWPNTNATKWVQFPDASTKGIDVLAGKAAGAACPPLILADDFLCRQPGKITDIHIWASWLGDQPIWNLPITLCIWSDVPAITNVPPRASHP